MNIAMLLEMVAETVPDQRAVGALTYAELLSRANAGAGLVRDRLVAIDTNSVAIPIGLFSAAIAGVPYVPVNYRLADEQLRAIVERAAPGTAIVEPDVVSRLAGVEGIEVIDRDAFLDATAKPAEKVDAPSDPDEIAVLLFTSGTTGTPKAAV